MKTVAVCFVCGSKGASSALSIKPRDKGAYFSFLENHELPNGAKKPTEDGIVNACLVCYAFLNEQWNSYERNKVPLVKRLYWLKRVDNRAFTGAEMSLQGEYVAQVMGLQYNSNIPGSLCPFDYGSHIGISCGDAKTVAPSPTNDSNISPNSENSKVDGVEVLDLSISPKKPRSRIKKAQKPEPVNGMCPVDAANSRKSATPLDIVCYTCGNSFQNSRARFIYATKFSDEEPFFPFIYTLPEPKGAMAISKNGLTQVCCNCRKALCRQWKIFEARSIPISERSYRINDMPVSEHKKISTIPRNKEYGFSEFEIEICYLCGEVSSVGSMHSIGTRSENGKTRDSMVLPFIESLKPAPGVHPVGNKGKVNTCSACYNFLFLQWKQFDTDRVPPEKQSFVLRSVKKNASYSFNNGDIKTTDITEQVSPIKFMQFSKNNYQSSNPTCPSSNLLLDLKVENEKDTGSIQKNHLQSKTDFNENMTTLQSLLQIPTELSPSSNIPISGKQLPVGNECNKTQHCFLCNSVECWVKKNGKVSSEMFILCSRPMDNNQNLSDAKRAACQPFFPFISELATSSKTKSMSADGTVVVCGVCYYNLMAQWISFENVEKVLEQKRWKRKYKHDLFACLVCKQVVHRHETKVMPFEKVHRFHGDKVPLNSTSDELKYVPVCNFCCNEMKSDNGSQKREKKQLRNNSQMSKICKPNKFSPPLATAPVPAESCSVVSPVSDHLNHSEAPGKLKTKSEEHEDFSANDISPTPEIGNGTMGQQSSEHLLCGRGGGNKTISNSNSNSSSNNNTECLLEGRSSYLEALKQLASESRINQERKSTGSFNQLLINASNNDNILSKSCSSTANDQTISGFKKESEADARNSKTRPPLSFSNIFSSTDKSSYDYDDKSDRQPVRISSKSPPTSATSRTTHSGASVRKTPSSTLPSFNSSLTSGRPSSSALPPFVSDPSNSLDLSLSYKLPFDKGDPPPSSAPSQMFPSFPDPYYTQFLSSQLSNPAAASTLLQDALRLQMQQMLLTYSSFNPHLLPLGQHPFFPNAGLNFPTSFLPALPFTTTQLDPNSWKPFTKLEEQENVDETHSTCSGSYDHRPSKNGLSPRKSDCDDDEKTATGNKSFEFSNSWAVPGSEARFQLNTVDDNQKNNERKSVFHRPFLESEVSEPCSEEQFHESNKTSDISRTEFPRKDEDTKNGQFHSHSRKSEAAFNEHVAVDSEVMCEEDVDVADGIPCKDERLNAALGLISLCSSGFTPVKRKFEDERDTEDCPASEDFVKRHRSCDTSSPENRSNESSSPGIRNNLLKCNLPSEVIQDNNGPTYPPDRDIRSPQTADVERRQAFHWPGIEAVMESYDKYRRDQSKEWQFLMNQQQIMKSRNQDLLRIEENLSRKFKEHNLSKQSLETERLNIESHIDQLKSCLKLFSYSK